MFTLTVQDEQVYRRLMEMVEKQGGSVDDVLRQMLDQSAEISQEVADHDDMDDEEGETRAMKLLRLIDEAEFIVTNPFNARDAEEIMREELGLREPAEIQEAKRAD